MKLELSLVFISIVLIALMAISLLSVPFVIDLHFYLLLLLLFFNFYRIRRLNLFQVWIGGFIFIILSEMLLLSEKSASILDDYVDSILYLLTANNVILLGYLLYNDNYKNKISVNIVYGHRFFLSITIVALFFYLYKSIDVALNNFFMGRQVGSMLGSASLISVISTGLGLILPAIIAYYFKYIKHKSFIFSLIFVLPIFLVQLLLSTRFHLLFSVIPYLVIIEVIDLKRFVLKKYIVLFCFLIFLIAVSSFLKEYRNFSLANLDSIKSNNKEIFESRLSVKMASRMSPEGVVEMTKLANEYYSNHPLSYGKEVGFILWFWIPRSIWKDKPTPIDHWLIRKYENVPDGLSTASGFTGELRADFGYFSFFFLVIIGILLKKGDIFIRRIFSEEYNSFNMVLAAMLFPYVFFFVRSPLAASETFLFELIVYKVYSFMYTKKILIIN